MTARVYRPRHAADEHGLLTDASRAAQRAVDVPRASTVLAANISSDARVALLAAWLLSGPLGGSLAVAS